MALSAIIFRAAGEGWPAAGDTGLTLATGADFGAGAAATGAGAGGTLRARINQTTHRTDCNGVAFFRFQGDDSCFFSRQLQGGLV